MKKITEFQIRISSDSVCSMLNADRSLLADEMREELEEMLSEAYERLEPAAYLGFGDTEGFLYGEDQLPGQEALYVICTVGERLSGWSSELFRQGDCVRAMLADAAADNCLFQLDGQLREQISALCREHGRGIRRRLEAPQDAPMRIQKKALDVTGAAQYGIGITEGFMYRPVKSVCQVYLLSENPEENNSEHDCSRCPNTSCRMRRSQGDVTEPSVTVITGEGQRTLPFVRGKSILETLRENGIYIAALCSGRGTCGKCRIRVIEGTLPVSAEDRLFFEEAELEAGFRLACTAFPEGGVHGTDPGPGRGKGVLCAGHRQEGNSRRLAGQDTRRERFRRGGAEKRRQSGSLRSGAGTRRGRERRRIRYSCGYRDYYSGDAADRSAEREDHEGSYSPEYPENVRRRCDRADRGGCERQCGRA